MPGRRRRHLGSARPGALPLGGTGGAPQFGVPTVEPDLDRPGGVSRPPRASPSACQAGHRYLQRPPSTWASTAAPGHRPGVGHSLSQLSARPPPPARHRGPAPTAQDCPRATCCRPDGATWSPGPPPATISVLRRRRLHRAAPRPHAHRRGHAQRGRDPHLDQRGRPVRGPTPRRAASASTSAPQGVPTKIPDRRLVNPNTTAVTHGRQRLPAHQPYPFDRLRALGGRLSRRGLPTYNVASRPPSPGGPPLPFRSARCPCRCSEPFHRAALRRGHPHHQVADRRLHAGEAYVLQAAGADGISQDRGALWHLRALHQRELHRPHLLRGRRNHPVTAGGRGGNPPQSRDGER